MGRYKYKLLPLLFLSFLFIQISAYSTIVTANETDTFPYHPVFWEDWKKTGLDQNSYDIVTVEDTYAVEVSPTQKNGGNNEIGMDCTVDDDERWAYLKFDLTGYGGLPLAEAYLYIYCYAQDKSEDYHLYPVSNQTWLEEDVCWNDKPTADTGTTLDYTTVSSVGWWHYSSEDLTDHVETYLGSNCSVMTTDDDGYDALANWHRTKEYGVSYAAFLRLVVDAPSQSVTWNENSTISVLTQWAGTIYTNVSIYRDLFIDDGEDSLDVSCMLRTNATANYENGTFLIINYKQITTMRFFGVWLASNEIGIAYYNWSGVISYYEYPQSIQSNQYYTIEMKLDSYVRQLDVTVKSTSSTILEHTVNVEAIPAQAVNVSILNNMQAANRQTNIVWVEAPFNKISGLREWHTSNLDETLGDTPYTMYYDGTGSKNGTIKCKPFQGIKFQWNWTGLSEVGAIHTAISIGWYTKNGSLVGDDLNFRLYRAPVSLDRKLEADLGEYTVTVTELEENGSLNIAIWVEKSGKAYFYVQTNPHSSEYSDFWIYEISPSSVSLDSWGIVFIHNFGNGIGDSSCMKEVEWFYGHEEGISQPRFGGMWWQYNPILVFFFWIASVIQGFVQWIAAVLAPVITAVGTYLAPFVTQVQSAVLGLATWLSDQLDAILNIWGVIGSIVADVATEFVNNFIVPLWNGFANWFITNFITGIFLVAIFLQSLFNQLLAAVSQWFWGDPTVLPNLFATGVIFLFETIKGIGYFLISGRVAAIGIYLLGLLNGFVTPIGWETVGASTIPDFIMMALFWVVSYAPVLFFIYITTTLLRVLTNFVTGDFSFDAFRPFWDIFQVFWKLAEFAYSILRTMLNAIWSVITAIMEIIPF